MRLLLVIGFIISSSTAANADGIFGIRMGMAKSVFDIAGTAGPSSYKLKSVPEPDPHFAAYAVKLHPSTGACLVVAISHMIETGADGKELKAAFATRRSIIDGRFGNSSLTDHVRFGSVWDEPDYYMTALEKKEAMLSARWHYNTGAGLGHDIGEIILIAETITRMTALITIQVKFNNYRECQKAIYYRPSKNK